MPRKTGVSNRLFDGRALLDRQSAGSVAGESHGCWGSRGRRYVARRQARNDLSAQSQASALRQRLRELFFSHGGLRGISPALAAAEPTFLVAAGFLEELFDHEGFELLGGGLHGLRRPRLGRFHDCPHSSSQVHRRAHQITSNSASSAPAARRFCRIAITSRGVEPMAARACTSSSTVAPCLSNTLRAGASLTFTPTLATAAVVPADSGGGCEMSRQDSHRRNVHIAAHYDGTRALIHHYPRRPVRIHREGLHVRDEINGPG